MIGRYFGSIFIVFLASTFILGQDVDNQDQVQSTVDTKKPVDGLSNAEVIEFAPSISADGKTIIFETNRGGSYALFETRKQSDGSWSTPRSLESINNYGDSTDLIAGPSISFDGNLLYFSASIGMGNSMDIYVSNRTSEGWSAPEKLGENINSPQGYEGFPSISADGKTLYFVKENTDGPRDKELRENVGFCLSIFKSELQEDGSWGNPIKLPGPINQDCEKAPRIMADGRTMIFSSNRPGGKGDYDMYQSKLNEIDEWSLPVPLNFVNTPQSDQLPCISAEGDLMYYTYDNKDIYSVVIPAELRQFKNIIIQGKIIDQDSKEGIKADILVKDALTSNVIMKLDNNADDGHYLIVLPAGNTYNIDISAPGYSGFYTNIDLRNIEKYEERYLDVELFKSVRMAINISDKELFTPIPAIVQVRKKGEGRFLNEYKDIHDGRIIVNLPIGSDYEFIVSSENFKSEIFTFNISGLVMYRDFEQEIELQPEKVDVKINVADMMNNSKVRSKIVLRNKDRDEYIEVSGNEVVRLRAGDRYELEATSDQGYAFNSTVIDVTKNMDDKLDVKLQKLETNARLTLKDILFETNSAALNEISYTELNRVVQMMKENPSLQIEIAAHTDDVGSDQYNVLLSQKRAQSVVDYLMENRIEAERFVAKGYGESQPRVVNDTEENRAINRRVELIILGV
ncbi:MAG: OmpA family protein [Candidatus Cyclobacteriaceae bacterium M2_1C_046]